MKVVGCIPAKGTSSRVESKNMQKVLGVPLFLWAANNLSRVLNKKDIYIDSDSDEIIELAVSNGYNYIKRSADLATNATDGNELMLWEAGNVDADVYIQHLPPMIFLKKETIEKALDKIKEGYDSAFAVSKEQCYRWGDDGPKYDLKNIPNSFTLPTTIIEGMGFYVTKKEALFETRLRVAKKYAMIEIDCFEAVDIDYPIELEFARSIAKGLDRNSEYTSGIKYQNDCDIKLLVVDVDGVMTDGGMYYTESGDQFKKFNTKDGLGIKKLQRKGINVAFLSSGVNKNLINNRAETLGVTLVHAGAEEKSVTLKKWMDELGIEFEHIAYIGDDVNDFELIKKCALTACPKDAVDPIKNASKIVLNKKGGNGCVREFVDNFILKEYN
ncbi:MAG: N-acylneuraminate cytidylyltransferase [bacterium]|nr:N-acylneuraminate cytidylyltransferase [bacterium]